MDDLKHRTIIINAFKRLFALLFLGTVLSLVASPATSIELPSQIAVDLAVEKTKFSASDQLRLRITYTNISSQTLSLLTWGTALDGGITEDYLEIEKDGVVIAYTGVHAKRAKPEAQHFVELAPGESKSATVNIAQAYSLTEQGRYEIRYKNHVDAAQVGKSSPVNNVSVEIELTEGRPVTLAKQAASFRNCSVSQQTQINQALTQAGRIAGIARNDLSNAPTSLRPSAVRYREWFGQFDAGRYAFVSNNMSRIASALSNQRIGFDCDCTRQPGVDPRFTFAFVFPNDPFNMTLCDVFWRVSLLGTDSRSGTIVHEVSHFNIVADTDDFRPNQAGIRQLAQTQPNSAARAANAYEYFAENTPFLSMPTAADLPAEQPESEPTPDPEPEPEDIPPAFIVPILDLILSLGDPNQ